MEAIQVHLDAYPEALTVIGNDMLTPVTSAVHWIRSDTDPAFRCARIPRQMILRSGQESLRSADF